MLVKDLTAIIKADNWKFHLREPFMTGIFMSGTLEEVINKVVFADDEIIAIVPNLKKRELNIFIDHYKGSNKNGKEHDGIGDYESLR